MKRRNFLKTGGLIAAVTGCTGRKQVSSGYSGLESKVFEPIKIGNITIPNRIVFPAIGTGYADGGFVTQRLIGFYKHVAEGSAGLTIVGATSVRKDGEANLQMIDDDKYIEGCGQLFETIKQNGSIACIQLFPGAKEIPEELSVREIEEIVNCFAEAAYRAKTAGADMIELHGAHGYLINKFLSPLSNKRDDEYGGSTENRARFVKEIVKEIRKKVGNNFPICCRISAIEIFDGGLTIEESKDIAQILVDSGINLISVSVNGYVPMQFFPIPFKEQVRRCYAYLAREIKESVDIPVICVGNILDLTDAEIVLQDGDADMTALGRALIADPYLISKTRQGREDEINYCIQCRKCIWFMRGEPYLSCSVNKNL